MYKSFSPDNLTMFLKNYPAMKINSYLVVADLHIGITNDIYNAGITLPKQSINMAEKLNKLKRLTKTKNLIILGDVKHKFLGFSLMEKMELEKFIGHLKFSEIIIVKGNHDGDIEKMIRKNVKVVKSFEVSDYFLTHGHMNIKTKKKIIVIGHNQPHVKFRDEMGAVYIEPVWIKGSLAGNLKGKRIIMMPAFNELCGATIINRDKMLGPIAKQLNPKMAHVYMLDGVDLGRLADIKRQE